MENPRNSIIFFKKYKLLDLINSGSFGSVFNGINISTKKNVAIKIEKRNNSKITLEHEALILYYLKGPGLPEIITFGRTKKYNILIQTLLGKSLYDIFISNKNTFSTKDICNLAIQIIERLEYVHTKDFIHRDVKPQNFLIGKEDKDMIYIIDFGISKKYRSSRGHHVKFSVSKQITGTPRFSSVNAMRGVEQSRKDDLESFAYMIIYFFKGALPWQGIKRATKNEIFEAILEMKRNIKKTTLCEGLPNEILNLYKYVKKLGFSDEPNYNYLKNLFLSILNKNKLSFDNKFTWIKEKTKNKVKIDKKNVHNLTLRKPKISITSRLLKKIQTSLEKTKKRNISINNPEKDNNYYSLINLYIDNNSQRGIRNMSTSANKNKKSANDSKIEIDNYFLKYKNKSKKSRNTFKNASNIISLDNVFKKKESNGDSSIMKKLNFLDSYYTLENQEYSKIKSNEKKEKNKFVKKHIPSKKGLNDINKMNLIQKIYIPKFHYNQTSIGNLLENVLKFYQNKNYSETKYKTSNNSHIISKTNTMNHFSDKKVLKRNIIKKIKINCNKDINYNRINRSNVQKKAKPPNLFYTNKGSKKNSENNSHNTSLNKHISTTGINRNIIIMNNLDIKTIDNNFPEKPRTKEKNRRRIINVLTPKLFTNDGLKKSNKYKNLSLRLSLLNNEYYY